jgi:hypothetical protein
MNIFLKRIVKDKNSGVMFGLAIVLIGGFYLLIDRPNVKSMNDLEFIQGQLDFVDRHYNPYSKTKKDQDLLYYIHLDNYPSHFQVSYASYDENGFYQNAKSGDTIVIAIAKADLNRLNETNENIRAFSLRVNGKIYLQSNIGLSAFGQGYFELGMILFSGLLLTYFIIKATRKHKTYA